MSVVFRLSTGRYWPVMAVWGLVLCCVIYVLMFLTLPSDVNSFNASPLMKSSQMAKMFLMEKAMQTLSPLNMLKYIKQHSNGSCTVALDMLLEDLRHGRLWALQMVDASTKLPSGLLQANLIDLGSYDECVDITVTEKTPFNGQHCLATLQLELAALPDISSKGVLEALGNSLAYTFSLCMPSTCSSDILAKSLSSMANEVNMLISSRNMTIKFVASPSDCHVKLRPPLTATEVLGIVVTIICVIAVLICTIVDLTLVSRNKEKSKVLPRCLQMLTAFSLYTNGRRLVDLQVNEDTISVLHSLKYLSIAWVAIGHRIKFTVQQPVINLLELTDYIKDYSSMVILNATLSVDVFFLISGILNTYVYMNIAQKRNQGVLSHIIGYIHRYIRLTPAYALMILITATWLYRTGDGPLWDRLVGRERGFCTEYWWSNLLYINNYNNPNENCMMQSWYLAADMQLFWLSPLVLYPLWRWPGIGLFNLLIVVILSIVIPFLVAFIYEIKTPIPISLDQELVSRQMTELYTPTHTKTISYVIGILAGYFLYLIKTKQITFKISCTLNVILWLLAHAFMAYGLFGGYSLFQLDSPYNKWESSLYIGIYRFFWSVGLAWFVIACSTGHGGIINRIFSLRLFMPLGRLTYCVYLTHVAVILYGMGSMRQPQHFSYYEMLLKFLGEFIISTVLAAALSLTVEAPLMVLEKMAIANLNFSRTASEVAQCKRCFMFGCFGLESVAENSEERADELHLASLDDQTLLVDPA